MREVGVSRGELADENQARSALEQSLLTARQEVQAADLRGIELESRLQEAQVVANDPSYILELREAFHQVMVEVSTRQQPQRQSWQAELDEARSELARERAERSSAPSYGPSLASDVQRLLRNFSWPRVSC